MAVLVDDELDELDGQGLAAALVANHPLGKNPSTPTTDSAHERALARLVAPPGGPAVWVD